MASVPRSKEALREILSALACDDSDFYLDLVGEAKSQMEEAYSELTLATQASNTAESRLKLAQGLYDHHLKTYNDVVALQEGVREERARPDPGLKKVGARRKKDSIFAFSQEFQTLYPQVVDYYKTEEYPSSRRCAEILSSSKYKVELCRKSGILNRDISPISKRMPVPHIPGSIKTWAYGNLMNLTLGNTIKVEERLFLTLVNRTVVGRLCVGCGHPIPPGSKSVHFTQNFGTNSDHYYYHLGEVYPNKCVERIRPDLPVIKVWYVEVQNEVG